MAYTESNFQTEFGRRNEVVGVFELKITKNKRFAFTQMRRHQIEALLHSKSVVGCAHKISDASYEKKPFDCFRIANYSAYVVVMFYVLRKKKMVYYLDIADMLQKFLEVQPRKSLTEEDVKEIAIEQENYLKRRNANWNNKR